MLRFLDKNLFNFIFILIKQTESWNLQCIKSWKWIWWLYGRVEGKYWIEGWKRDFSPVVLAPTCCKTQLPLSVKWRMIVMILFPKPNLIIQFLGRQALSWEIIWKLKWGTFLNTVMLCERWRSTWAPCLANVIQDTWALSMNTLSYIRYKIGPAVMFYCFRFFLQHVSKQFQ